MDSADILKFTQSLKFGCDVSNAPVRRCEAYQLASIVNNRMANVNMEGSFPLLKLQPDYNSKAAQKINFDYEQRNQSLKFYGTNPSQWDKS